MTSASLCENQKEIYRWSNMPAFSVDGWIGSGMVLQRDRPIQISGLGIPSLKVEVKMSSQKSGDEVASCEVGEDSRWAVTLSAKEAGGPWTISITPTVGSQITYKDIYIGDVWICSGQSNMEMPVWSGMQFYRLTDGEKVAAEANDPMLRLFQIDRNLSALGPCHTLSGRPSWKSATTEDAVKPFSAVGYYFGYFLRKKFPDLPIGIVHSSWGGSHIEAWIPATGFLKAGRTYELEQIEAATHTDVAAAVVEKRNNEFYDWIAAFEKQRQEQQDLNAEWQKGESLAATILKRPGVLELRFPFEVKADAEGHSFHLHIDWMDDADETYLDGVEIGAITPARKAKSYWAAPRDYYFTAKRGSHNITINGISHRGGFFVGESAYIEDVETGEQINLRETEWQQRIVHIADMDKLGERPLPPELYVDPLFDTKTPTGMFNGMVAPLDGMKVKGALWYQGCSNNTQAADYANLQRILVDSWREFFDDPKMPFIVTQLAGYYNSCPYDRLPDDFWKEMPTTELGFAHLRQAQESMHAAPYMGLACTMDIGDACDIHPRNKRDVGIRLVHEAMRIAYGDESYIPGPRFKSMEREGSALRIHFKDVGEGLEVVGGEIGPHLFSVAGDDGKYIWADAAMDKDGTVVVSAPEVVNPVSVRYAFICFAPNVNIKRKVDGLPLFPFEATL